MVKRRKGFTLIELLVVITIIAVLAAILFPVFMMARAKARALSCMQNMKQFGATFQMYLGDWDAKFPITSFLTGQNLLLGGHCSGMNSGPGVPFYEDYNQLWIYKLEPYIKYNLIRPGALLAVAEPQGIMKCKEISKVHTQNNVLGGQHDEASYGYNFLYLGLPFKTFVDMGSGNDRGANPFAKNASVGSFVRGAAKMSTINNTAETICLVENATIWAFPPYTNVTVGGIPTGWPSKGGKGGGGVGTGNGYIRDRHSGRSNILWCDGHVTSMDTKWLVLSRKPYGDARTGKEGAAMNNALWDVK